MSSIRRGGIEPGERHAPVDGGGVRRGGWCGAGARRRSATAHIDGPRSRQAGGLAGTLTRRLPPSLGDDALRGELVRIVKQTPWFMTALVAVQSLRPPAWCIGAGVIRNLVWDHLHGRDCPEASPLSDIDVAYFDATDLRPEAEARLQTALTTELPGLPWEVTNQAGVHLWFESLFGHPVEALDSLEAAVATWPEFATAVAVRLDPDGELQVIAPHGLDDLFDMRVRRNPVRVSLETYRARVVQKRYVERWPRVQVENA